MNINTASGLQNSPSFGIKYVEPRKWNPDILDALMKSKLVKQIDCKYPTAEVIYKNSFSHVLDFNLSEGIKTELRSCFGKDDLIKKIKSCKLRKMLRKSEIECIKQTKEKERVEAIYQKAEEINNKPELADKKGHVSLFKRIRNIFNKQ